MFFNALLCKVCRRIWNVGTFFDEDKNDITHYKMGPTSYGHGSISLVCMFYDMYTKCNSLHCGSPPTSIFYRNYPYYMLHKVNRPSVQVPSVAYVLPFFRLIMWPWPNGHLSRCSSYSTWIYQLDRWFRRYTNKLYYYKWQMSGNITWIWTLALVRSLLRRVWLVRTASATSGTASRLITDLYALDCCLRRSRRFASAGISCKGHERKRGTPHFRCASHCDGVAEHREDSCGE